MNRRSFSARALAARLLEYGGKCAACECRLGGVHGAIQWDHVIPLAMRGRDEIDNLQPLCAACHKAKTKTDKGHIAKGERMEQRAAGIRRQARSPLPGSRQSKWKRKVNGQVVRRDTGEPA